MMILALLSAATVLTAPGPGPVGLWLPTQDDARHVVRIVPCGSEVCGFAGPEAAAVSPPGTGIRVLEVGESDRGQWHGRVFDPRHGHVYKASLKMLDADHLRLTGCLVGPLCGSQVWTRAQVSASSGEGAPARSGW